MTIRNLEFLFKPSSVALIGASAREVSVGHMLALNLLNSSFAGEVWLVNPKHGNLFGRIVYRKIKQLPVAPELAIIATPPETVPSLIRQLGEKGTRAAIVISAGFADMLDYLANDTGTDAILLYMEGIQQARKFMSAARAASHRIPSLPATSSTEH